MDEKKNLEDAQKLWNALKGISEDAFIHFLRILHLGMLVRQAPTVHAKNQVYDVLCCGISDKGSKFVGANIRLRLDMAGGKPSNVKAVEDKLGVKISAFDDDHSKLHLALIQEEDGKGKDKPIPDRPYENCAEHVVFEKLERVNEKADATYAVQKVQRKEEVKSVKCVKRCKNCLKAGGQAVASGASIGQTPRLGAVVTDHDSIADKEVPINTATVMMFIRSEFQRLDKNAQALVLQQFPHLLVWHSLNMKQATPLALNGSEQDLKPLLPKSK